VSSVAVWFVAELPVVFPPLFVKVIGFPCEGSLLTVMNAGFGYGNMTEQNGAFVGEGVWVTCGTVGRERITISGDTFTSTWWYKEEGDTTNPAFITVNKLPSQGNPITLTKSGGNTTGSSAANQTATEDTCWWLNQGVDLHTTNIGGKWQGGFFTSICLTGADFARGGYNGSTPPDPTVFAGSYYGVNADSIGLTGVSIEARADSCFQGCDMFKLTGDGNSLAEKFWCVLDITTDLLGFGEDRAHRVAPAETSINQTNSCFFAVQPQFGFTPTALANASYPSP
jgi:hypothetical protein